MLRTAILTLAVGGLAIGFRLPVLHKIPPGAFGGENESVAKSLMHGNGWSDAYGPGTGPTAHVSPIYPLILQSLYRVYGSYETEQGRLAQQYCSLAVSVLVVLLLPAVARKLGFPTAVGWSAAFLAAWLPAHRWHHVVGFDQGLAALILLALIWSCATIRDEDWKNRRSILWMGVLLGLTALCSPNLLLVPSFFFIVEFLRREGERRQVFQRCFLLATVAILMISPWAVRNHQVLGGFVPLRSNFGLELAIGNRSGANGHTYAPGFYELHPLGRPEERERLVHMGEIAYMKDKQRQAVTWIADHPPDFAWLTLRRAFLFWFSPKENWYSPSLRPMLSTRVYGLLGVCLLLELSRLLWIRSPNGAVLTCAALGLGIPYFVTHVELRYTVPFVNIAALGTCSLAWEVSRRIRLQPVQKMCDARRRQDEIRESLKPSSAAAPAI